MIFGDFVSVGFVHQLLDLPNTKYMLYTALAT